MGGEPNSGQRGRRTDDTNISSIAVRISSTRNVPDEKPSVRTYKSLIGDAVRSFHQKKQLIQGLACSMGAPPV